MVHVVIIGAGIIGVSTGYRLKLAHPNVSVTIVAKTFSPNTISDGSAGFWEPFLPGDTPMELVKGWSKDTYDYVKDLLKNEPTSSKMGLMSTHGYNLFKTEKFEPPYWVDIPADYHVLTKKDLQRFPDYVKSGFGFTTMFIESSMLIPWYSKKFTEMGGKFVQREITSLTEVGIDYDILVNCSGSGSKKLLNDNEMEFIRGQIMKVRAPWIREFIMLSEEHHISYILPNQHFVVLGGTAQKNSTNNNVDIKDKEWIIKSTKELLPSLELAEPVGDWVGFRPGRRRMKVEREEIIVNNKNGSQTKIKVVHNYGHGGSGITVHWGCAGDAVKLISQYLHEMNVKQTSKL